MAQDRPTAIELLDAVREYLERDVQPELADLKGFHCRVAVNVLSVVARELAEGPAADAGERARLVALLGQDGDLDALNVQLAAAIRAGAIDTADPALLAHLKATTADKLRIANPKYR